MSEIAKVAIILPRLVQLGPILMVQELVNSLCEIGKLQITVFYLDKKVDPHVKMKAPVERLNIFKFPFNDFDIIHTNGIRPDLFAFIYRRRIKYHISTIHNFVFADLAFTYSKLISTIFGNVWLKLWSRADKLVCISESMETYYSKWFDSKKLEMIYYGVAEADNSLIPDSDIIDFIDIFHTRGLKVIGTACIITKRKGLDQVLNLLQVEKDFSIVIIGNGSELDKLKSLAKKLKIEERCFFTGFRSNAIIYFRYFDFMVFPSQSEGFGRVLVEAAQQKVPVICSEISVFKELFNKDEVTFFKLFDKDSLAQALRSAGESSRSRIDAAYLKYRNSYTDHRMANSYLNLYKSA